MIVDDSLLCKNDKILLIHFLKNISSTRILSAVMFSSKLALIHMKDGVLISFGSDSKFVAKYLLGVSPQM